MDEWVHPLAQTSCHQLVMNFCHGWLDETSLGKWQHLQHWKSMIPQNIYKAWQIMLGLTFKCWWDYDIVVDNRYWARRWELVTLDIVFSVDNYVVRVAGVSNTEDFQNRAFLFVEPRAQNLWTVLDSIINMIGMDLFGHSTSSGILHFDYAYDIRRSSKNYHKHGHGDNLELAIISHQLHVSHPTRSGYNKSSKCPFKAPLASTM